MSDKGKDERDIDEILASIDEMLAQKDDFSPEISDRKVSAQQAALDSEEKLGLSSSIEKIQPLEQTSSTPESSEHKDIPTPTDTSDTNNDVIHLDVNQSEEQAGALPRHRILLTEELLEPSAQESLPLWAAQLNPTNDDHGSGGEALSPDNTRDNIDNLDDFEFPDLDHAADEHNQAEPVKQNEETDTEQIEDTSINDTSATAPNDISFEIDSAEIKAAEINIGEDEFTAVFDAIARDDTITFDVSEAIDDDTVYDIQILDHSELVEAMVHDVLKQKEPEMVSDQVADVQKDEVTSENNFNDDPEIETESSATIPEDLESTQETTDLTAAEDKIEESHPANTTEQNNLEDNTVSLNPDELDTLIEAISDEVRIKLNHHLQQILPEVVSEALQEHLATQRTDT